MIAERESVRGRERESVRRENSRKEIERFDEKCKGEREGKE